MANDELERRAREALMRKYEDCTDDFEEGFIAGYQARDSLTVAQYMARPVTHFEWRDAEEQLRAVGPGTKPLPETIATRVLQSRLEAFKRSQEG
jgi:hypothetical protein